MAASRQRERPRKRGPSARIFILVAFTAFVLTLAYLWLYIEVGDTLREVQALSRREQELSQEVDELQAAVARLSSPDRITRVARNELEMIFPLPEATVVTLPKSEMPPENQ